MRISSLLNEALDGLFGFFLPDEVVEKVVDPFTDALGAGIDGATGRWDGAAKDLLDLAEDFAQWAGNRELARQIDQAAKLAGALLESPLTARGSDAASYAARELAIRGAGAAAGGIAGYAAKRDAASALGYGQMGASMVSVDFGKGAISNGQTQAAIERGGVEYLRRPVGAAVGAGAGAALGGEEGMKAGMQQGMSLADRLERLVRADAQGLKLATGIAGAATHVGGIAAGVYFASEWSVWRKGQATRKNVEAFHWAAGAGQAAAGMIDRAQEIGADGSGRSAPRRVAAAMEIGARAARAVVEGVRIHDRAAGRETQGLEIAAKILSQAPDALDWLARPPVAKPERLNQLSHEVLHRHEAVLEKARRCRLTEVPA